MRFAPAAPRGGGERRNASEPFGSMSARPHGLADIELNGLGTVGPFGSAPTRPFGSTRSGPFGSIHGVTGGEGISYQLAKSVLMMILLDQPEHDTTNPTTKAGRQ